jgi:hypothetical protein
MSSTLERIKLPKKDKEYPNFFNPCSKDTKILNTRSIYKHYPDINNNEIRQDDIISSRSQIIKSAIRPDISKIKNEKTDYIVFHKHENFSSYLKRIIEEGSNLDFEYWKKKSQHFSTKEIKKDLFVDFVNLFNIENGMSHDKIKKFADEYGQLGEDIGTDVFLDMNDNIKYKTIDLKKNESFETLLNLKQDIEKLNYNKIGIGYGEPIDAWKSEIFLMQEVLSLWIEIRDFVNYPMHRKEDVQDIEHSFKIEELDFVKEDEMPIKGKIIYNPNTNAFFIPKQLNEYKKINITPPSLEDSLEWKENEVLTIDGLNLRDKIDIIQFFISYMLNERIMNRGKNMFTSKSFFQNNEVGIKYAFKANSLIGELWRQCIETIVSNKFIGKCSYIDCRKIFIEKELQSFSKKRLYCNDSCKSLTYYENKSKNLLEKYIIENYGKNFQIEHPKYNEFVGSYKYTPDYIYKINDETTIYVEITRKITNNILNKYKTTIPNIKKIKKFLICDEEKIFNLDFSKKEFSEINLNN